jgi:iron complex transport system ATP-binding protein
MIDFVLELNDVTRVHGTGDTAVHALRGVSLGVLPGELVAVMGPSGSGKSTLLHLAGGLDEPTGGSVLVEGTDLGGLSRAKLAALRRRSIGYVFQEFNLIPALTAAENVGLPRELDGVRLREVRREAHAALDEVGLGDEAGRFPDELSGGQRQRVWIAMALAQETEVLLLDEPTTYLDLAHQVEVLDLITDLNRQRGTTVAIVLHDLNLASRYADHVIAMKAGRIVAEGTAADVVTEDMVRDVFGLGSRVLPDPISGTPLIIPLGRHHTDFPKAETATLELVQ